ncbi:recombinase family protein [Candidatus Hakubella thermalkaliphila]|uniref:Site-specific DNA recombinase n=1 Tax=Candidatus Hakubella thermalkaliphila TaxID=2754717 RepID=A0A6V8QAQ2_9ACTN|nr:recombinase family protein [Candidatus Hakubella thermalkaliphila]GFP40476.1 site-specific DNA recombinase [Candidatus Hakubella thermalkaliphila]
MNCLLYARVSTDKQAQKDLSIPAQIAAMKEYARRNGWKVMGHFIDEGESAKTADRPELKRLIQHCKENKGIDIVLVHKIDRLARNLIDYATIKAILKQKGIRLVSVSEPFDDNPIGHLLENIIASISEWYSANLGEEIKKANLAKLKKGEWPHKPPLGYRSVKGSNGRVKHLPDPRTAPLVRQAFELFSSGNYSLQSLAEEMHSRGLKTAFGRIYSPESLKTLLTRRFYIGGSSP